VTCDEMTALECLFLQIIGDACEFAVNHLLCLVLQSEL